MRESNTSFWICGFLLCIIAWFPVFHHMDFLPVWNYDEARNAVKSLEMAQDGYTFIPSFRGEPDNWDTKPPFLIWLQATFIKMLGPSEIAVRLPSALAGFASILILFFFVFKRSGSLAWAFFSALSLISFLGYCDLHVVRTGDYDSLLTLFSTIFLLSLFRSFESERATRWILTASVFLFLGLMTKGVVILMFGPGILAYLLIHRKFLPIAGNYRYYVGIGLAIGIWISYYFLRNYLSPGYMKAVWVNELGGRFTDSLENHKNVFWYYIFVLLDAPLFLFAPLAFFLFPKEADKKVTTFLFYLGFCVLGFWLFLSLAQTKIRWYAAPLMPLLSILIGYSIHRIIELVQVIKYVQRKSALLSILMCIVFFFPPYRLVIDDMFQKKESRPGWEFARYGWMMKNLSAKYDAFSVVRENYNATIDFYAAAIPIKKAVHINTRYEGDYGAGEKILFCSKSQFERMAASYNFSILEEMGDCHFVKIIHIK
ncbi:MAG: glycosyltransferase family 39 protein [Saprospiraceae bacterium]|nr:glycosyltransferase family 39 protein [Saprospiraceae bacterium]